MGLAASQARFLMLTARLSNIEYEGQQINQARSALADKTARAATEYQQAMTNRRLLFDPLRQVYNDKNNYQVLTYDSIVDPVENGGLGMRLVDENGKIIVPNLPEGVSEATAEANNYIIDDKVYDAKYLEEGLRNKGWNLQQPTSSTKKSSWSEYDLANIFASSTGLFSSDSTTWTDSIKAKFEDFKKSFNFNNILESNELYGKNFRLVDKSGKEVVADAAQAKTTNYVVDTSLASGTDFEKIIEDKEYKITFEKIVTYITGWANTDWRSTAGVFDELDKSDDGEAEAKYTELTAKYQAQDKQLEMRQKQLDSEHNAVQTEYDAVKKVIDKDVEKSFNTFG